MTGVVQLSQVPGTLCREQGLSKASDALVTESAARLKNESNTTDCELRAHPLCPSICLPANAKLGQALFQEMHHAPQLRGGQRRLEKSSINSLNE